MSDAAHAEDARTDNPENAGLDPQVEAKAREMGWKPKDEWEGDDSNWMDADKFVERNERIKERADGIAKAEISRLQREVKELSDTIVEFRDYYSKVEQKAQERALAELKRKQREAVETGDTAAFDAVDREIEGMAKDVASPEKKAPDSPDDAPAFREFVSRNDWYNDDIRMTAAANRYGPELVRTKGYGPNDPALYEEVERLVREEFPDKFGNPARKRAAAVESGNTGPGNKRGGKKGYADLPPEAKASCDKFVKQKLLTKEQYIKDYFGEED